MCLYMVLGAKDVRRQKILGDLFGYTIGNHRTPFNLLLITGDIAGQMDFVRAIHLLRSRINYNVLLAQPQYASG